MGLPFDYERDPAAKEAPLGAIFCCLAGLLAMLWALAVWHAIREGQVDGLIGAWLGLAYLAGAGVTTLLGIASLIRREDWKLWTLMCVAAVWMPLLASFGSGD